MSTYKENPVLNLVYESDSSCPKNISVMVFNVISDIKWILFILGLVIGPVILLFGYKLFRLTLILVPLYHYKIYNENIIIYLFINKLAHIYKYDKYINTSLHIQLYLYLLYKFIYFS